MTYPCPECGHDASEHNGFGRGGCLKSKTVIYAHHADRLTAELAAMTAERDDLKSGDVVARSRVDAMNREIFAEEARHKEVEKNWVEFGGKLEKDLSAMTAERDGLKLEAISCHQVIESSGKQMGELRIFLANTHQELAASQARAKELEGVVKEMAERMAKGVR